MKVKTKGNFHNAVFGADCFIEYWPEIESTGIEVKHINDLYYVIENDKIASDSAFFTEEEFENYLEVL